MGKEYVAHLIFERSKRADGIFVPVNCADFAGNPGLANSALFGHQKGAFTGALAERPNDIEDIIKARLAIWKKEGKKLYLAKKDWRLLRTYDWPGNVRQLLAVLKRVVNLGVSVADAIAEERAIGSLEPEVKGDADIMPASADAIKPLAHLDDLKRAYIKRCWELLGKNSKRTAERLGITRNTLRKWLDDSGA